MKMLSIIAKLKFLGKFLSVVYMLESKLVELKSGHTEVPSNT